MSRAERMMAKATERVARHVSWPQARVELPPEQMEELMRLYRAKLGVNRASATKAGLLRTALLEWWERQDPEPDVPIEAVAVEIIVPRTLSKELDRMPIETVNMAGAVRVLIGSTQPHALGDCLVLDPGEYQFDPKPGYLDLGISRIGYSFGLGEVKIKFTEVTKTNESDEMMLGSYCLIFLGKDYDSEIVHGYVFTHVSFAKMEFSLSMPAEASWHYEEAIEIIGE